MANILDIIKILSIVLIALKLYSWIKTVKKRKISRLDSNDAKLDFYSLLKHYWAEYRVTKRKQTEDTHKDVRKTIKNKDEEFSNNSVLFYGTDQKGNCLFIKFTRRKFQLSEVSLQLNTSDGQRYVLPNYPDTTVVNSLNQEWTAGGLKVEFLEFQKRWRIVYNGMLRNLARGERSDIEHVRLNFIFIANCCPLRWPEDWSSKLHADALVREPWSLDWTNKINLFDNRGFDQMGSMIGQITYKDASVSNMYLRGLHQHRWGKHEFHESVTLFVVMPLGEIYYLGVGSTKQSFPLINFGQFRHSNDEEYPIDTMDFRLADFAQEDSGSTYKLGFEARGREYNIVVSGSDPITLYHGQPWKWQNKIAAVKVEVDGKSGAGFIQLWSPYNGPCHTKVPKQLQFLKQPSPVQKSDYVLYFDDERCRNESVVGGKGFSLAALTSIEDAQFVVPKGFCVTIFALETQLHTHKELQKIISDIEDVSVGKKDGDLESVCNETMEIIRSTPLNEKVQKAILRAIETLQSDDEPRYAIRSSAVGEDSEETSAAGQNSTYLGVRGTENILESIAKCWASLFSYQSVNYRKQHGMFVRTSMGVCVQKMVNPDAAGVMFTRHPTTGDPSSIIITANYGLGETVVSASVEPDTIVVHKSWDNELTVQSSTVGSKSEKILATNDGVATVALNDQESKTICLSESVALRLAAIGVNLETLFGSARDIEWAVANEQIYLLQARPITTLYTWTEFELLHELDSGVPSDFDINTFANIGEVLPYPVSPLTISTVLSMFEVLLNRGNGTKNQACCNAYEMRCTLSYYSTFMQKPREKITLLNKVSDIAIFGKVMLTPELHKIACEKYGVNVGNRFLETWQMVNAALQNGAIGRKAREIREKLNFEPEDFSNAHSLYNEIDRLMNDYCIPTSECHMHASNVSIFFQIMAMELLTSGYTDIVPDHFSDIALLLSSCNDIVGTEIVTSLKNIVSRIKKDKKDEEFRNIESTSGIDWLKVNCPAAAEDLDNFMREHGHRCIQETDLLSEPWVLRPESLIATLQTMMDSPESTSGKTVSVGETVDSLKTPKSAVYRWLLKKLTPFCRKAVSRREMSKSIFIHTVHRLRLAFRRLGKLMVLEEYLPSEDLIFFLTIKEIEQILNHRNTTLVQKACRRKRMFPKLKDNEYPHINIGVVLPIKKSVDVPITDGNVKIEGTAVCGGSIVSRACVITDVSDAKTIRNGDILITRSTDVAWSPYFSLLSGIVTELGGLVSHGAVIAREYGLPCVIGAKMATRHFQTGDTVLLQADVGTLQLVKRRE